MHRPHKRHSPHLDAPHRRIRRSRLRGFHKDQGLHLCHSLLIAIRNDRNRLRRQRLLMHTSFNHLNQRMPRHHLRRNNLGRLSMSHLAVRFPRDRHPRRGRPSKRCSNDCRRFPLHRSSLTTPKSARQGLHKQHDPTRPFRDQMRRTGAPAPAVRDIPRRTHQPSRSPVSRCASPRADCDRESVPSAAQLREHGAPQPGPWTIADSPAVYAQGSFPAAKPGNSHIRAGWQSRPAPHRRKPSRALPIAGSQSTTPRDERKIPRAQFSESDSSSRPRAADVRIHGAGPRSGHRPAIPATPTPEE